MAAILTKAEANAMQLSKVATAEAPHLCCTCKFYYAVENVTKQGVRKTANNDIEIFRCTLCNRTKNKVGLILQLEPELKLDWQKVDKVKFNQLAADVYGDALSKLIHDQIEEITSHRHDISFVGTGEFMDEEDLNTKYTHKQARLAAIKKNRRTFL